MALLQASARASSQAASSFSRSPCSAKKPRTARTAGSTSARSHARESRNATPRHDLPGDSDIGLFFDYFEDAMQASQLEYLLHRRRRVQQPDRSAPSARGLVQ